VITIDYEGNIKMLQEIVDELNAEFDARDIYHHTQINGNEMFEGNYATSGSRGEKWSISFLGVPVLTGGNLNDMSDCFDDNYIRLEEKNRRKILLLAEAHTISRIRELVLLFANSNASDKNKKEWISILQRGLQEDDELSLTNE